MPLEMPSQSMSCNAWPMNSPVFSAAVPARSTIFVSSINLLMVLMRSEATCEKSVSLIFVSSGVTKVSLIHVATPVHSPVVIPVVIDEKRSLNLVDRSPTDVSTVGNLSDKSSKKLETFVPNVSPSASRPSTVEMSVPISLSSVSTASISGLILSKNASTPGLTSSLNVLSAGTMCSSIQGDTFSMALLIATSHNAVFAPKNVPSVGKFSLALAKPPVSLSMLSPTKSPRVVIKVVSPGSTSVIKFLMPSMWFVANVVKLSTMVGTCSDIFSMAVLKASPISRSFTVVAMLSKDSLNGSTLPVKESMIVPANVSNASLTGVIKLLHASNPLLTIGMAPVAKVPTNVTILSTMSAMLLTLPSTLVTVSSEKIPLNCSLIFAKTVENVCFTCSTVANTLVHAFCMPSSTPKLSSFCRTGSINASNLLWTLAQIEPNFSWILSAIVPSSGNFSTSLSNICPAFSLTRSNTLSSVTSLLNS